MIVIKVKIFVICLLFFFNSFCFATSNLDEFKNELDKFDNPLTSNIDISSLKNGIDYNGMITILLNTFFKEVSIVIKNSISIFIILIFIMLLKALELNNNSEISKVADFVCFLSVTIILVSTFSSVITMFNNTTKNIGNIMQITSPFLMGVLIMTGAISTSGIIQPLILFLSSFVGFVVTNLITPLLILSVAFNVVNGLSSSIKLDKFSKLAYSSSLWIMGIFLSVFLGILSLETSITKEVDSLAVKSTSAAVSNFVPVVGKFFSDSLEAVVGAGKIASKVGGVFAILTIIGITFVPLIKIISIAVIYYLLSCFADIFCDNPKICSMIDNFASIYKTMSGVLIAVCILFVIAIGIILNLISEVI